VPSDARLVLAAAGGEVVGVGLLEGGLRADLELLFGFEGPVKLLVITVGGGVLVRDAVVTEGRVLLDGVALRDRLAEAGFEPLTLRWARPGSAAAAAMGGPAGAPQGLSVRNGAGAEADGNRPAGRR
jgi:hypothetical protein